MTHQNVVIAEQETIDAYDDVARRFLKEVLDLNLDECLLTDETRLGDFSSCGMPAELADNCKTLEALYDAWDGWVVPRVCQQYRIEPFATNILLVELFRLIEARESTRLQ